MKSKKNKKARKSLPNPNSPENYGPMMNRAYQSRYGKVPTSTAVPSRGVLGMPQASRSIGSRVGQGIKGLAESTAAMMGASSMAKQGLNDLKGSIARKSKSMKTCKVCGSKKHMASAHKTMHMPSKRPKSSMVKSSGSLRVKSNKLGFGGRAAKNGNK